MSYVAEALNESFASNAGELVAGSNFNQEEVVEMLPAVQGMIFEAITFMEVQQWPDSDQGGEGTESEAPVGDGDGGTGEEDDQELDPSCAVALSSSRVAACQGPFQSGFVAQSEGERSRRPRRRPRCEEKG